MERRVLLAITLSFLVLFLFQRFVMPPPAPVPAVTSSNATSTSPGTTGAQPSGTPASVGVAPPSAPSAPAVTATVSESNAREVIVETTKVKAVFSNKGATIVHWILKEFRTDQGKPLDLVPAGAGADAV